MAETRLTDEELAELKRSAELWAGTNTHAGNVIRIVDELLELRRSVATLEGLNKTLLHDYHEACAELQKSRAEVGRLYTISSRRLTDIEALQQENKALRKHPLIQYAPTPTGPTDQTVEKTLIDSALGFKYERDDLKAKLDTANRQLDVCRVLADGTDLYTVNPVFEESAAVKSVRSLKRRHDELSREVVKVTGERDHYRHLVDKLREYLGEFVVVVRGLKDWTTWAGTTAEQLKNPDKLNTV